MRAVCEAWVDRPDMIRTVDGGYMVPMLPEARMVPSARFWSEPRLGMVGSAMRPSSTISPPMMPDIAAMMMAMTAVTMAMPPRVRLSQMFRLSNMSRAMPERSSRQAM